MVTWDILKNPDKLSVKQLIEAARVFDVLAEYCRAKQAAMRYREHEQDVAAQHFETECKELYAELPEEFKW